MKLDRIIKLAIMFGVAVTIAAMALFVAVFPPAQVENVGVLRGTLLLYIFLPGIGLAFYFMTMIKTLIVDFELDQKQHKKEEG